MADLEHDLVQPGRFRVRSSAPQSLARVPDILAEELCGPADVLACWALHPSEQDGAISAAYHQELGIVGAHARTHIEELARPRERNVIWVDRYHFTCAGAAPATGGPLLGLYVTTPGRIATWVYPPDSAHQVTTTVAGMPHLGRHGWDAPPAEPMARYMVSWTPGQPGSVSVGLSAHLVPQVAGKLAALP